MIDLIRPGTNSYSEPLPHRAYETNPRANGGSQIPRSLFLIRGQMNPNQVGRFLAFSTGLFLTALSAASLANLSSLNRAVFARTASASAT
jgi:hypothetical protein